jgi:hypothetical protein
MTAKASACRPTRGGRIGDLLVRPREKREDVSVRVRIARAQPWPATDLPPWYSRAQLDAQPPRMPSTSYFVCTLGQAAQLPKHDFLSLNHLLEVQAERRPDLPVVGMPVPLEDGEWDCRVLSACFSCSRLGHFK